MEEKDPVNTKKSTKLWLNCFNEYLAVKSYPKAELIEVDLLPEILEMFYSEVQKKPNKKGKENGSSDQDLYKNTTAHTIRAALARFYREKKGIDIISNEKFIHCNAIFTGIQKINKKKGLGKINRKQPMNDYDINQLMEYFRVSIIADLNPKTLQDVVIFHILYYMCRRGCENLRSMKQYIFAISTDPKDGRKFIYQAVDEYDKNHNETDTDIANEGRIYEIPGKFYLFYKKTCQFHLNSAHFERPLHANQFFLVSTFAIFFSFLGSETCPVRLFQMYISKLPPCKEELWLKPKKKVGMDDDLWYEKTVIGPHPLDNFMKLQSECAGLSRIYTNHCIRSTVISNLDEKRF